MASPSKLPEPTAPSADAGDWWADMIGTKLNSATGPLAPVCPANISQTAVFIPGYLPPSPQEAASDMGSPDRETARADTPG